MAAVKPKMSTLGVLMDPRRDVEERRTALEDLVARKQPLKDDVTRSLQRLIKYEPRLRYDAFHALLNLLPDGYSEKGHSLATKSMMKSMIDSDATVKDVASLVRKDPSVDLVPIAGFAVDRMFAWSDQLGESVELLHEIFCLKNYRNVLSQKQTLSVLEVASTTAVSKYKKILKGIAERNSPKKDENLFRAVLNNIETSMSVEIIESHSCIRQMDRLIDLGYVLADKVTASLVENLFDVSISDDLLALLQKIEKRSRLGLDAIEAFLRMIKKYEYLLRCPISYNLMVQWLRREVQIDESIFRKIANLVEESNVRLGVFRMFKNSISIPEKVIQCAFKALTGKQDSDEIRLTAAEVLVNHLTSSKSTNTELLDIILKCEKYADHQRIILRYFKNNPLIQSEDFVMEYFFKIVPNLRLKEGENLETLKNFIYFSSQNVEEKIELILTIGDILSINGCISTDVFNDSNTEFWRMELLAHAILARVFYKSAVEEELHLQRFNDNLTALVMTLDEKEVTIEDLLLRILTKQIIFRFTLSQIIDLLIILRSPGCRRKFCNNPMEYFVDLTELLTDWILDTLAKRNIVETKYSNRMRVLLSFNLESIASILSKVTNVNDFDRLIEILRFIQKSEASQDDQKAFISECILENLTIERYLLKLSFFAVENSLRHRVGKVERPLKKENAYNSFDSLYIYSSEDVSMIASQLMKYQADSFSLTIVHQLLDLSRALHEAICCDKINVFLVHIGSSHWVLMIIVMRDDRDLLVMYKDSLGAEDWKFERDQIMSILQDNFNNFEFIQNTSKEQFDEISGGVFVLSNLQIALENLQKCKEEFSMDFSDWVFATHKDADKNRRETFRKLFLISHCVKYRRIEIFKHHRQELLEIKKLLKVRLKKVSIAIKGEKKSGPHVTLSIDFPKKEALNDRNYKYLYIISLENCNEIDCCDLKNDILRIFSNPDVEPSGKYMIRIKSDKLRIPKQCNLDLKVTNASLDSRKIKKIAKDLNVPIDKDSLFDLGACFRKSLGYRVFKYKSSVYKPIPRENDFADFVDGNLINTMKHHARKLFEVGWSIQSVVALITAIESVSEMTDLINCIEIIWEYGLREYETDRREKQLIDIVRDKTEGILEKKIHALAIHQTFKNAYEKPLDELEEEIKELNINRTISNDQCKNALMIFRNIMDIYEGTHRSISSEKSIKEWTQDDIKIWAAFVKANPSGVNLDEKLAVLKRAVEVIHGISPRNIQILSLIIMCDKREKGRLVQINTGEGKTTIIAMLATYLALDGHKVDVVTSSPELARPQSQEQAKLFELFDFGMRVETSSSVGNADIVYGYINDFQATTLKNEYFSNDPSGCKRVCDVAIVDEVDSMLVDDRYHILKLSEPIPGMNNLETLLAAIWMQIDTVANAIVEKDGNAYYVEKSSTINENGEVSIDESNAIPIQTTKSEFIKICTEMHLRKLIRDTDHLADESKTIEDGYPELKVPSHLRSFVVEVQIPKWIESAINARYWYENKKHYILRDDKVSPVDTFNTGVVQESMYWSNGLHQFLQIKHGAKITPESLTTNYLSNITFFKRYGGKLYGLTGTLGDDDTKQMLQQTYEVDDVIVPSFRTKQYRELPSIVLFNQETWYDLIVDNVVKKLNNGRAALIIARYIDEAESLAERFKNTGYDGSKIRMYRTDQDSEVIKEVLQSGEVILTTNISGRGTNIKVSYDVESNGGLHVCLTAMPVNSRVHQQNVGRTSREGRRGTSQFILFDEEGKSFDELISARDLEYKHTMKQAEKEVKRVLIRDSVFRKFCLLLQHLENRHSVTKYDIASVKERFGLWIKVGETKFDYEKQNEINTEFEKFQSEILTGHKIISNLYYHIQNGNDLLRATKYKVSISHFQKAIESDHNFAENAYYSKACALIATYGEKTKSNKAKINEAVKCYRAARNLLDEREKDLQFLQRLSNAEAFSQQILHKLNLINLQKNNIDVAIGVDVEKIKKEIDELIDLEKKEGLSSENLSKISTRKSALQSEIDNNGNGGVIGNVLSKGYNMKIEFKDTKECMPEENINLYKNELDEFTINGYIGGFVISEVKPICWLSVIGMLLLGLVQMVVGAAIAVFSLGAATSFGVGLLIEGVSDIVTAVKDGIINRDFNWESWAIQKAISLAVSVVCAGMQAIKCAAKTAYYGVKGAVTTGTKVLTQSVKEGWKIVAKKIGLELAKGVAKEVTNSLLEYGVDSLLIPKIQEEIVRLVKGPIQNSIMKNKHIEKMLQLDAENGNRHFEHAIEKMALNILAPKQNHVLYTITKGIAAGIANNKLKGFAKASQYIEAIKSLATISTYVPVFIEDLNNNVKNLADQNNIFANNTSEASNNTTAERDETDLLNIAPLFVLKSDATVSKEVKRKSVKVESKPETVFSTIGEAPKISKKGDINIKKKTNEDKVKLKRDKKVSENLKMFLSEKISSKMCTDIKNNVIMPPIKSVTTVTFDLMASSVDESIKNQVENYQAERRIAFNQDGDPNKRLPKFFKARHKDPKMRAAAENEVFSLENNGEAGLPHLGALSETIDRPIKILDEKGRVIRYIGEHKSGDPVEVQYHPPNDSNPRGHWTLPGGVEPRTVSGNRNDCLFNVLAEQTRSSPDELRRRTVSVMRDNTTSMANQMADIHRLRQYKITALQYGGARYVGTGPNDAKVVIDNSQGVTSHGSKWPGHPRGHASDPTATLNHGGIDCVENYSYSDFRGKTGFMSRWDQDAIVHQALLSPQAQNAMANLNSGLNREVIDVSLSSLTSAGQWVSGSMISSMPSSKVKLVLEHHVGQKNNPNADVFVRTAYLI